MRGLDRERRLADAANALERRDRQRPAFPRQRRHDRPLLLDPSREIGPNLGLGEVIVFQALHQLRKHRSSLQHD